MAKGYDKKLCGNHDDLYCKPEQTKGQGPEDLCNPTKGEFHVQVDQIFDIAANDTAIMAALMKFGPLSIAANADDWSWYKGGVIDYKCPTFLNHAVLITGYSNRPNEKGVPTPSWTILNSWGESWGEQGTLRIVRGKNMCGMNNQVVGVTAKKL